MRLITNTAFMEFLTGSTMPAEEDNLYRHMARNSIANQVFNGKGGDSEEALGEQITAYYQGRRNVREFDSTMREEVWKAALSGEMGEKATDWPAWRTKAKTLPGFDSTKEPEYLQRWHDYTVEARARMSPYKPQLARVWKAMKNGGAGSPSEIIKSIGADLLLGGGSDGEDTWDEFQKEDAGAAAFEIYDQLEEKERADFMNGIHMLVRSFPKEEQASILTNLAKTGGRSVDDIGHGIFDRFKWSNIVDAINEELNQGWVDSAGPAGASDKAKAEARQTQEEVRAKRILRTNFVDKIREMERGEYAPIRHFSDSSTDLFSTRTLEDGVYAIPSMAAYAGTALVPYVGAPAMLLAMEDMAYKDLRDNAIRSGASELDASLFADRWKTEAAIPQTAVEMLQTYIPLGKIPAVNRLLTSAGDRITSRFVRGALTAGAVNVGETVTEELQHLTPYAVQELAHAFAADTGINSAEWHNGKDGALDGIWTRSGVNFIAMGPMSAASIPGVLGKDQRMRAFAEATPTQRLAFGLTAEDSAAIDVATLRGPSSLAAAVDTALENRDPNSGSAAAAVAELERQHAARQEAVRQAQENGILPRSVQSSDGSFTLYDTTTGEEIATAPDAQSATRIATTHANMVEERDSDRIAALPEKIESESSAGNNQPAAELSPEHVGSRISQVAQQTRAQEQIRGGSGEISEIINGRNSKEQRRNIRKAVQELSEGSDIPTTFREIFRANRRRAHAAGLINLKDDVAFLRAYERASARGKSQRDETNSLLPDNFDALPNKEQSAIVERAMTGMAEAEILRSRGRTTGSTAPSYSPGGLSAVARLAPETALKTTSLINAVRGQWGLSLETAIELKNEGSPEETRNGGQDVKLDKLLGRDSRVQNPPLTPTKFYSAILDHIGTENLLSIQPNVSIED
ncbi:MAG: hypothetical protein EOP85_03820, partial [Verrucomicrobiaceae bacterium]